MLLECNSATQRFSQSHMKTWPTQQEQTYKRHITSNA